MKTACASVIGSLGILATLLCAGPAPGAPTQPPRGAAGPARDHGTSERTTVSLRVIDLAAGRAYLAPGSKAGLRSGDVVQFGAERFKIIAVSGSFAVVNLEGKSLPLGARGSTTVLANRPERIVLKLPKPAPLASFRSEGRALAPPAAGQSPKPVPLTSRSRSASSVVLTDAAYAVLPMDGGRKFVSNEARAKVRYQPYSDSLFRFDLDAAAITYTGDGFSTRRGAAARQVLRVRELRVAYGAPSSVRAALGRLGAASLLVGQLDGARLDIALGERLRLSTFGGLSPQTFSGVPSTDVARFGGEVGYDDPASALRPRLVLGAHASRFDGTLDERKVYATFDLLPPKGRLGAFGEVAFFDAENPWNARGVELTAASLEGAVQIDVFFLGTRLDLRRPDRSRYLQSLLPREWLCWADPARPAAPCVKDAATYSWMVDGGVRVGKFSLDIGGQSRFTRGTDATNFGGFANLRWIDLLGKLHLDAGMSAFSGSMLRSVALSIAPGLDFAGGNADLTLRYRPAIVRDRATLRTGVEHSVGAGFWLSPHDSVDVDLEADWIRADPVNAITAQALFGWRFGS